MDIQINSLCPHELVSDNGGGVKFNNGLDLQGLYLYEKYYPYKQEEEYKAAVDAGEDTDGSKAAALEKWKTSPVGIVFKNAAVVQGSSNDIVEDNTGETSPHITYSDYSFSVDDIKYAGYAEDYYFGEVGIQQIPVLPTMCFSNTSSISTSYGNGAEITTDGVNKEMTSSELKNINMQDTTNNYALTDRYLLHIPARNDNLSPIDVGGLHMKTSKYGKMYKLYSFYTSGGDLGFMSPLLAQTNMSLTKCLFVFPIPNNNNLPDDTIHPYMLLDVCNPFGRGLGTKEALEKAVTDGDAVFVYRDDLLNFTKFVQEKLGVTVV